MLGFEIGFDKNFFAVLKKKLLERKEFEHGTILFNEMQVRKAKYLSTKTMSYIGLSDDDDGATSKELDDHTLVFMLCPFGDMCPTDQRFCFEKCMRRNAAGAIAASSDRHVGGSRSKGIWIYVWCSQHEPKHVEHFGDQWQNGELEIFFWTSQWSIAENLCVLRSNASVQVHTEQAEEIEVLEKKVGL